MITQTIKCKLSLFIWLTEDQSLQSKEAKFSILWSISHDQLTQAEVNRYKLQ